MCLPLSPTIKSLVATVVGAVVVGLGVVGLGVLVVGLTVGASVTENETRI